MAYKSLKFVYGEQVFGTPVPALPRQQVVIPQQEEQQSAFVPWPPNAKAVPFVEPSRSAEEKKQGEGNGERRVLSLYIPQNIGESDEAYFARLGKYTSGTKESFDVRIPKLPDTPPTAEDSKFDLYEVKEIKPKKDVRIAKTGHKAEGRIATAVISLMKYFVNIYNSLETSSKQTLNTFLIDKIRAKGIELDDNTDWTLKEYCTNIINFPRNMGKQFLHSERLTKLLRGDRKKVVLLSLDELETCMDAFCLGNQEGSITATPDENKRINDNVDRLFKLLSDLYLPKNRDDTSEQGKELEAKAEEIDRELTAYRCSLVPGECRNNDWFCAAWNKIKSAGFFNNIKEMLIGNNSQVEDLFPREVKGLYIVSEEGYEYVPRENLKNYIYISSLAGQGVKIARIQDKSTIDSKSEEEEDETF